MSETFKKANQATNDAEDDSDDSDDESDEEDEQQSSSKNFRINWKYTPGQLAVTESNDVLDTRIDAVWALARYLILSHASSSSSVADLHTSHVDRILPVLLRIFISLPYYRYDRVNFPHVTPLRLSQSLINLLSELGHVLPVTRKYTSKAIIVLLEQLSSFVDPNVAHGNETTVKRSSTISESPYSVAVLEGLLTGLSDRPFPFNDTNARVVGDILHKLFQSKYLIPPSLYGQTLRLMTTLLAHQPQVFEHDRLKYLFEHEFMRASFTYPSSSSNAHAVGASTNDSQVTILVHTIQLGVLVGLLANSKPSSSSSHGTLPVNCTPSEEQSLKERALAKLKEMLDQLLNVRIDPLPASASASSTSSTSTSTPTVVLGCVDAARALLNGVMELANKYASDGESIRNIVEAIKTILLHSRRLAAHPKEKQLRYLLTISISKVFKLELMSLQQQSSAHAHAHRTASSNSNSSGMRSSASSSNLAPPLLRHRQVSLIDAEDLDGVDAHSHSHANHQHHQQLQVPLSPKSKLDTSSSSGALDASHMVRSRSSQTLASYDTHTSQTLFTNSTTRTFVQALMAQMYKDESLVYDLATPATNGSETDEMKAGSSNEIGASHRSHQKASLLYQRTLILLLDLVALIQHPPLTRLVMPSLIARLLTRASPVSSSGSRSTGGSSKYLYLIIPQLIDIALTEERRWVEATSSSSTSQQQQQQQAQEVMSDSSSSPSLVHADLAIFDQILHLLFHTYAHADVSTSKKTMVELPSSLKRLATALTSTMMKTYLLKRTMKVLLEMGETIRIEEMACMIVDKLEMKTKKKSAKNVNVASQFDAGVGVGAGVSASAASVSLPTKASVAAKLEACAFLLPVIAVLMRDCYLAQSVASSPSTIGLQLYASPETNAKWFRRLWFFLVHFHFTDLLVLSPAAAVGAVASSLAGSGTSSGVGASLASMNVAAHWATSLKVIAFYSTILVNPLLHNDYLSSELTKEYERITAVLPKAQTMVVTFLEAQKHQQQHQQQQQHHHRGSDLFASSNSTTRGMIDKIVAKLTVALNDNYKQQVTSLFPPSLSYELSQLSMGRIIFLLTVVHLETIRVKSTSGRVDLLVGVETRNVTGASSVGGVGVVEKLPPPSAYANMTGFQPMFAYLTHYPLQKMGLFPFLTRALSNNIFPLLSKLLFTTEHTTSVLKSMESIVTFLLRQLVSRRRHDRELGLEFVRKLTDHHRELQWNTTCLTTLLELLLIVGESLETSVGLQQQSMMMMGSVSSSSPLSSCSASNSLATLYALLDLPDDLPTRETIFRQLLEVTTHWLNEARTTVPERLNVVLQEFIQRTERNMKEMMSMSGIGVAASTSLASVAMTSSVHGFDRMNEGWRRSLNVILALANSNTSASSTSGMTPSGILAASNHHVASISTLIGELNVKERYLGEIKGLFRSYQEATQKRIKEWQAAKEQEKYQRAPTATTTGSDSSASSSTSSSSRLAGSDSDPRKRFGSLRSMSVLIQQQSADAFTNLLARHVRQNGIGNGVPSGGEDHITNGFVHELTKPYSSTSSSAAATASTSAAASCECIDDIDRPQIAPFGKLLTAKLIQEGNQILSTFHQIHLASSSASKDQARSGDACAKSDRDQSLALLHQRFERLICLAAALLIWSTQGTASVYDTTDSNSTSTDLRVDVQDLLHLLVKTPCQLFTASSMAIAIFAWQWILQSQHDLELPLMIEMRAAWAYTVDRQVGLFSHRRAARQQKEEEKERDTEGEKKLPLAVQTPATANSDANTVHGSPSGVVGTAGAASSSATSADSHSGVILEFDAANTLAHRSNPSVSVAPGADGIVHTAPAPNMVRPPTSSELIVDPSSRLAIGNGISQEDSHTCRDGPVSPSAGTSTESLDGAWSAFFQASLTPSEVIAPHLTWVNFLLAHFRYLPSFSRDIVNLLASMIHKSFARPDLLSSSEKSFGCRFRLLNLGLKLIQAGGGSAASNVSSSFLDLRDKQLLRDRIYHAALLWFQSNANWQDVAHPRAVREDVTIVLDFLNGLKEEEKYWNEIITSGASTMRGVSSPKSGDHSYPIQSIGVPAGYSASGGGGSESRLDLLTRQRNLLTFLLSHELDRIYTWYSPLAPSTYLPPQGSFTCHRGVYAAEWKRLISTAWEISPKLCVRIGERFQQSHIVRHELTRLVQTYPESVYDLPEAVVYLVTEDVLRLAVTEPNRSPLRHLIYWCPTTLPIAIWFLGKPFCTNRLVLEYAVHTLRCHPPDTVMFYLSQIIQCLRNDSEDHILYHFLLESSKASILLGHQLLWLSQAELGEVKSTTVYVETPFRQQCARLIADVIRGFDAVEKNFFQQEFEFFEQITAISGILKPIPTKQGRKDKIREELLKIDLPNKNIYLPTNPQLQVRSIIATSGAPMQSAAKVPILVAFKVAVGELDLTRERRHEEMKRLKTASATAQQRQKMEKRMTLPITDTDANGDHSHAPDQLLVVRVNGPSDSAPAGPVAPSGSLEPDEIDLILEPEADTSSSVSRNTSGVVQQLHTAMAKERKEKLDAAKSTADTEGLLVQACIFKVGDDCRQDALALQVIQWCKNIMQANGLELFLVSEGERMTLFVGREMIRHGVV